MTPDQERLLCAVANGVVRLLLNHGTKEQFAEAARERMETLYRENNGTYQKVGGREPIVAFRETPDALRRECAEAITAFEDTWDSEWK